MNSPKYPVMQPCFRLLIILLFSFFSLPALGQNIYDYAHTREFADYLYTCGDYHLAAEEYFNAYKLNRHDTIALKRSFYLLAEEDNDVKILNFSKHIPDSALSIVRKYIIYGALQQDDYMSAMAHAKLLKLSDSVSARRWSLAIMILNSDEENVQKNIDIQPADSICETLLSVYDSICAAPKKKPWPYMTAAALIPGSGHMLAGDSESGMQLFFLVGINAFQAYKTATMKPGFGLYPIAFAVVSFGFYVGQIYGAGQLIKVQHRHKQTECKTAVLKTLKACLY